MLVLATEGHTEHCCCLLTGASSRPSSPVHNLDMLQQAWTFSPYRQAATTQLFEHVPGRCCVLQPAVPDNRSNTAPDLRELDPSRSVSAHSPAACRSEAATPPGHPPALSTRCYGLLGQGPAAPGRVVSPLKGLIPPCGQRDCAYNAYVIRREYMPAKIGNA